MNDGNLDFLDSFVNSLEHHGVEGQKWGKRHGPPYPLDSESKAKNRKAAKKKKAAEKRKKEIEKTKKRIAKQEANKQKEIAREEATKAKKEKDLAEKKSKYAKDPKTLYEHRDMFTYEEIAQALDKFEWERKIKNYVDQDYTRAKSNIQTFADFTKTTVSFANSAIDGYNIIASLNQHFGGAMKPINKLSGKEKDKKKDND